MAPEILNNLKYTGASADLFACGVILFQMVAAMNPFGTATPSDDYYRYIIDGKHERFWEGHG